jgi:Flp pilus assembly protein TadD
MNDRETTFREMTVKFPDSAMAHFSLGRLCVDEHRWAEALASLSEAVRLDPNYAAAWVSLGDAEAGRGDKARAREAWGKALRTPHGQRDGNLQADLQQRMQELDEF